MAAYIACILYTIYSLLRLYSFRPLIIFRRAEKGKRNTSYPHLYALLSGVAAFAMSVCLSFTVFEYWLMFLRENLFLVLVGGFFASTLFFVGQSLQGLIFVELALATIKQQKDTRRLLTQMRILMLCLASVVGVFFLVGHLGVHLASTVEMSVQFARLVPLSFAAASIVWMGINIVWSTRIISSIETHLQSMGSMLQGDFAQKAADLTKLQGSVDKLKQLRVGTTLAFSLNVIAGLVAGILPVLMQYWFGVIIFACLGGAMPLFTLRPPGWKF